MGCVKNIAVDNFPIQGNHINKRCEVCFHMDFSKKILGTIVRDDAEEPCIEIIKLDDGRYVLSSECQFSLLD